MRSCFRVSWDWKTKVCRDPSHIQDYPNLKTRDLSPDKSPKPSEESGLDRDPDLGKVSKKTRFEEIDFRNLVLGFHEIEKTKVCRDPSHIQEYLNLKTRDLSPDKSPKPSEEGGLDRDPDLGKVSKRLVLRDQSYNKWDLLRIVS